MSRTGDTAAPPEEPSFRCTNCGRPYPEGRYPFRCPACGAHFDFAGTLVYAPAPQASGVGHLWRYSASFPPCSGVEPVSLGEGGTPLVGFEHRDRKLHVKCEYTNPTGSFKDRGTAVLVTWMAAQGIQRAVEDSSGNAGASFAAYAARAGIEARVLVPDYASGPKRRQIEAFGAQVVRILGPRSKAAEAALRAAEQGLFYASHAYLPHGLAGMATVAFELFEGLGRAPGSVVTPVGQGSLLLGLDRGFKALQRAGEIDRVPVLVGVQARACAPIWAVHAAGATGLLWTREGETVAEGIRIFRPLRGDEVLRAVEGSGGTLVAVEEGDILRGRDELGARGFYVEATSAVVWPALEQVWDQLRDPVVVLLTGAGLKGEG